MSNIDHLIPICPACQSHYEDGHGDNCVYAAAEPRMPSHAEEVACRYNTREMVEAVQDWLRSPEYETNKYSDLVREICAAWEKTGEISDRQFYALAVHVAAQEKNRDQGKAHAG